MASIPGMNNFKLGTKRAMIDKANASMLVIIGVTSFVVTFSLISCRALVSQGAYQNRVIDAKAVALKQLKENNKNINDLVSSYSAFASGSVNILGGNTVGKNPLDGDNPKIVLDALPSKYDFPGLISGLGKLLAQGGYKADAIGGTDDELAQQNSGTENPQPVEVPFPLTITTTYDGARNLLVDLERSIRPIYVNQATFTASGSNVIVSLSAKTYYLPEKTLKIGSKVIK